MELTRRSEVIDLKDASYSLRLSIKYNVKAGTIKLSQMTFSKKIPETFGMIDSSPNLTLHNLGQPVSTKNSVLPNSYKTSEE